MSKQKIIKSHVRVAIFGSARIKKGDPRYRMVFSLAKMLAEEGIDIVTGGGPGLMDAANKGHHASKGKKKVQSIGLAISLPKEQKIERHLDVKKDFDRFSGRLDTFMMLSNAVVVAPGGIGTLLEFLYTWQLVQVKHICEIPIILLGPMWPKLIDWIKKDMLRCKLVSKKDFKPIFLAKTSKDAVKIIKKICEDAQKVKHACDNFECYKTTLESKQK